MTKLGATVIYRMDDDAQKQCARRKLLEQAMHELQGIVADGIPHLIKFNWAESIHADVMPGETVMRLIVRVDEPCDASDEDLVAADFLDDNGMPDAATKLRTTVYPPIRATFFDDQFARYIGSINIPDVPRQDVASISYLNADGQLERIQQ